MAGTFTDVPGQRFAYDIDGSIAVAYSISGGAIGTFTSTDLARANQDQAAANSGSSTVRIDTRSYVSGFTNENYFALMFPEVRTVTGYFLSVPVTVPTGGKIIQTSSSTTNGQDGTWTTVANPHGGINGTATALAPSYRTEIQAVNWTNITALRIPLTNVFWGLHLYGTISPTLSPNRLRIVDLSNNDMVAQLDFANLAQRSSSTKQFRVKNQSATQTANNITVSLNSYVNSDSTPSLIGQYQVSTDNIAFANAVNIGSLAPGASSAIMYVRMAPSATAQLGPWAARVIAHPVSWS